MSSLDEMLIFFRERRKGTVRLNYLESSVFPNNRTHKPMLGLARTQTARFRINHEPPQYSADKKFTKVPTTSLICFLVCLLVWLYNMYMYIYICDLLCKSSWFSFYQFSQYRIKAFLFIKLKVSSCELYWKIPYMISGLFRCTDMAAVDPF